MLQISVIQIIRSKTSTLAKQVFALAHKFRLFLLCALLFIFLGIVWYLFDNYKKTDPIMVSQEFLAKIAQGDIQKAKTFFGGRCPCTISGGWISYLIYKSGQEPNLAFLEGAHFSTGHICKGPEIPDSHDLQRKKCLVTIPLTFSGNDRLFFLPVKMAFGNTMEKSELLQFSDNPEKDWQKGFTLRLRPSISKGVIDHGVAAETKNANSSLASTYEKHSQDLVRLLGDEIAIFFTPADAGAVIRDDKTLLQQQEVEQILPRVYKVNVNLLLVQKNNTPYWSITQHKITGPILQIPNGNMMTLKEPAAKTI